MHAKGAEASLKLPFVLSILSENQAAGEQWRREVGGGKALVSRWSQWLLRRERGIAWAGWVGRPGSAVCGGVESDVVEQTGLAQG